MSDPVRAARRGYVDGRFGQLHYRSIGEGGARPPLVCLHATAYSGRSFGPLLPALAASGRRVIAPDTPGYGESDGPSEPETIEVYAESLGEAISRISPGGPVDLFGYHTGALLATELAAQRPELVRRLVLIGVPFFPDADEHARWRSRLVHTHSLADDLAQFEHRWDFFITSRSEGLPLARGFANFVDELKAWPNDWFSHQALFDYQAAARLPLVRQPVLVINPKIALAPASAQAAALMSKATVIDMPELPAALFERGADALAAAMEAFLDT